MKKWKINALTALPISFSVVGILIYFFASHYNNVSNPNSIKDRGAISIQQYNSDDKSKPKVIVDVLANGEEVIKDGVKPKGNSLNSKISDAIIKSGYKPTTSSSKKSSMNYNAIDKELDKNPSAKNPKLSIQSTDAPTSFHEVYDNGLYFKEIDPISFYRFIKINKDGDTYFDKDDLIATFIKQVLMHLVITQYDIHVEYNFTNVKTLYIKFWFVSNINEKHSKIYKLSIV